MFVKHVDMLKYVDLLKYADMLKCANMLKHADMLKDIHCVTSLVIDKSLIFFDLNDIPKICKKIAPFKMQMT